MSSSDSEDDSFLNIAQKLSAMKNNYRVTNTENLKQNEAAETIEETTTSPSKRKARKEKSPVKSKRKQSSDSESSGSIDLDAFRSAFPPIAKAKRRTRARKRISPEISLSLDDSEVSLPKQRKKEAPPSTSTVAGNSSSVTPPKSRGRGRGKTRGKARGGGRKRNSNSDSGRGTIMEVLQAMFPIYSVGNTEDYPDQSNNQQLFGNGKKDDVVETEDLNESLEDNEELSVKVYWQSSDYFKFPIRKYQKFTILFEFFGKKENVSHDKLLFTYNDKILKPEDTPDTINYSIVKFIDGGVVNQSVAHLPSNTREDKDGVKLKFQCQNVKKPFAITVKPDDKLSIAMLQCAEHFEKPLEKLRFEFDGDTISGKNTPKELELEGGECIDVKILS